MEQDLNIKLLNYHIDNPNPTSNIPLYLLLYVGLDNKSKELFKEKIIQKMLKEISDEDIIYLYYELQPARDLIVEVAVRETFQRDNIIDLYLSQIGDDYIREILEELSSKSITSGYIFNFTKEYIDDNYGMYSSVNNAVDYLDADTLKWLLNNVIIDESMKRLIINNYILNENRAEMLIDNGITEPLYVILLYTNYSSHRNDIMNIITKYNMNIQDLYAQVDITSRDWRRLIKILDNTILNQV